MRTGIPVSLPRQFVQVHIICQGSLTGMNLENLLPRLQVGRRNKQQPIKPSRPQQSRVNNVRSVRGRDNDNIPKLLQAIHLGQKLAYHTLSHVRVTQATATSRGNRVNLVKEYYTWRSLPRFPEDFSDRLLRLSHELVQQLRPFHADEVRLALVSNRLRQQRLTRPRRPIQQQSFRRSRIQLGKQVRIF